MNSAGETPFWNYFVKNTFEIYIFNMLSKFDKILDIFQISINLKSTRIMTYKGMVYKSKYSIWAKK